MKVLKKIYCLLLTQFIKYKFSITSRNTLFTGIRKFNAINGNVLIGDDFFSGEALYVSINKYCKLVIGDAVMFGPEVMILGGNHDCTYNFSHMRYNLLDDKMSKDIHVESGAWVSARVTLLSGCFISEGAVIGANSLVNGYILPYSISVGSPAKAIKCRFMNKAELETALKNCHSAYSLDEIISMYIKCGINIR